MAAFSDDELRDARVAGMAALDQNMAAALADSEVVDAWIGLAAALVKIDEALADRGVPGCQRVANVAGFVASSMLECAHRRGDTGRLD